MFDKLFYIVYNYYYSNGNYKEGQTPGVTVLILFGLSLSFYLITSYLIIEACIYGPAYESSNEKAVFYGLALCAFIIIYYSFFINKRSYQIYDIYKDDVFLNSKKAVRIGFAILIFAYIYFLGFAFILYKILS